MSIHDGHRQRLKERFCKEGLDNFDELHVLEFLLFYCVSRRDTNLLAHELLNRFGSLKRVLDASRTELMEVEGIGEHTAVFLTLVKEVSRYYEVQRKQTGDILTSIEQCGSYIVPYFYGRENETVFLLCLDSKCKVLCCKLVSEGSVNSANISVRKIVETALRENASSVIVAHNHPSGVAVPSGEDLQTTIRLAKALKAVEITLVDHIVVADDDYVSMAQSGMYSMGACQDYV